MWLIAAEADAGGNSQLIIAVFTLLGVVVTAIGAVIVALINSRGNRTTPSPPSSETITPSEFRALRDAVQNIADDVVDVRERTAEHGRRLDDHQEAIDVQDHRLDRIERAKDHDHPGWRQR